MKQIIITLLLFVCMQVSAQTPRHIPYRKGNLWGYSNVEGKIVIPCKYYSAGFFRYKDVYFTNSKTGKEENRFLYLARVYTNKTNSVLIDTLNQTYNGNREEFDGIQEGANEDEQYIYIDKNRKGIKERYGNKVLVKPDYEDILKYMPSFGVLIARKSGAIGVADTAGNILVPFFYDEIQPVGFEYLLFFVKKNEMFGIYDIKKGVVLPCKYVFTDYMQNSLIFTGHNRYSVEYPKQMKDTNNFWYLTKIYKSQKGVVTKEYVSFKGFEIIAKLIDSSNLYGVLNNKNEWIVSPKYKEINIEYGEDGNHLFRVTLMNAKEGYVSNTGKEYFEE